MKNCISKTNVGDQPARLGFIAVLFSTALISCGSGSSRDSASGDELNNESANVNNPVSSEVDNQQTPVPPSSAAQPSQEESATEFGERASHCGGNQQDLRNLLLALTNEARAIARQCGSQQMPATIALELDANLSEAALQHSIDMTEHNFFDHTGSDGLSVGSRATEAGFVWSQVGENIAAGQIDTTEVMQTWIDSPGHCSNIMTQGFTHMGAACVEDASTNFQQYWTVVFGTPR